MGMGGYGSLTVEPNMSAIAISTVLLSMYPDSALQKTMQRCVPSDLQCMGEGAPWTGVNLSPVSPIFYHGPLKMIFLGKQNSQAD